MTPQEIELFFSETNDTYEEIQEAISEVFAEVQ